MGQLPPPHRDSSLIGGDVDWAAGLLKLALQRQLFFTPPLLPAGVLKGRSGILEPAQASAAGASNWDVLG